MPEYRADRVLSEQDAHQTRLTIPTGLLVALIIAVLALPGIITRYYMHGDLNLIHSYLILFFSINLLICYWEACLFLRHDYIEARTEYWCERRRETGRTPAAEFFLARVPLTQILSPTLWADTWRPTPSTMTLIRTAARSVTMRTLPTDLSHRFRH